MPLLCGCLLLRLVSKERHRRAFRDHLCKLKGVPIRESDASVGDRFADLCRLRGAVNAVPLARQCDPNEPNRIVWAWRNSKRLFGADTLETVLRIVAVGRILGHVPNL